MTTDTNRLKLVMEQKIEAELARLSELADVCVFALYDPVTPDGDPIDFYCVDRRDESAARPPLTLSFNGVGVWYFAFRRGETFTVRKVLLRISDHRFIDAQVGDFEGYWEDFPQYVAEDRWVQSIIRRNGPANANDSGSNGPVVFRPGAALRG
ncbi:hypothetical protein EOI86_07870 [Hwanghaeella grinnelliae]|uniref:Uncharacterized protein n=1 Tax=Hwanghaeella grinnelliae TaxID=2500179 RepID=A0A3S2W7H5_9PROT|nr:hypothetical protein [Hwanghaeella grinnelliae]RVU39157.1 hypothetical protein EOI86_07870 [Hwanghaeella grinnelliae]